MKSGNLRFGAVFVLSTIVLAFGFAPSVSALTENSQATFTIDCAGFTIATGGDYYRDRDNTGGGTELVYLRFYDGEGTLLSEFPSTSIVGSSFSWQVGASAAWTTAPAFNPISAVMVSPAGNGFPEQVFPHNTGMCAGLPSLASADIPTLGGIGIALLVILMGLAGTLILRRSVF